MDEKQFTRGVAIAEVIKLAILGTLLYFVFNDLGWTGAGDSVFKAVMEIVLAYFLVFIPFMFGREFSEFYPQKWRSYLLMFYGLGILTVVVWAGSENLHGAWIFFTLLIPSWYGVYRGKGSDLDRMMRKIMGKKWQRTKTLSDKGGTYEKIHQKHDF